MQRGFSEGGVEVSELNLRSALFQMRFAKMRTRRNVKHALLAFMSDPVHSRWHAHFLPAQLMNELVD